MAVADTLEQLPMTMGYFRLILRNFGDTAERRAAILLGTGVTEAALVDPAADISLRQQVRQFENLNALEGPLKTCIASRRFAKNMTDCSILQS